MNKKDNKRKVYKSSREFIPRGYSIGTFNPINEIEIEGEGFRSEILRNNHKEFIRLALEKACKNPQIEGKEAWADGELPLWVSQIHRFRNRRGSKVNGSPPLAIPPELISNYESLALNSKPGWISRRVNPSLLYDESGRVSVGIIKREDGNLGVKLFPGFEDMSDDELEDLEDYYVSKGSPAGYIKKLKADYDKRSQEIKQSRKEKETKQQEESKRQAAEDSRRKEEELAQEKLAKRLSNSYLFKNLSDEEYKGLKYSLDKEDKALDAISGTLPGNNIKDVDLPGVSESFKQKMDEASKMDLPKLELPTQFSTNFPRTKKKKKKTPEEEVIEKYLSERSLDELGDGYGSKNPYLADALGIGVMPAIANKIISSDELSRYDKLAENDAIVSQSAKQAGLLALAGGALGGLAGAGYGWHKDRDLNSALFGAQVGSIALGSLGALAGGFTGAVKGKKIAKKRRENEKKLLLKALYGQQT